MVGLRFLSRRIRSALDLFAMDFDVARPLSRPVAVPQNAQFMFFSGEMSFQHMLLNNWRLLSVFILFADESDIAVLKMTFPMFGNQFEK